MRPIKELMQIMLDNVGEIKPDGVDGLCGLSSFLMIKKLITDREKQKIYLLLNPIIDKLKKERGAMLYAFPPGLVEPRRELLEKIISEL